MGAATEIRVDLVVETDAHEGPVYVAEEDALYFTTVPRPGLDGPRVDIRRVDLATRTLATIRADANAANGMALAPDGRLLVCEQGSTTRPAAITLVDRSTGATETLVDGWRGRPLNSPNDVVVRRDGTIWFTDPSYGHLQGFRPAPALGDRVYRYGGEEFLIILDQTTLQSATTVAQRLCQCARDISFQDWAPELRISVSIGVTQYSRPEDWQVTIARADHALYRAKNGGRDRFEAELPPVSDGSVAEEHLTA